MQVNKRIKGIQKYVVRHTEKIPAPGGVKETFQYFNTLKEARQWAKSRTVGECHIFKMYYDYIGQVKK